jgi:hypothetical protein
MKDKAEINKANIAEAEDLLEKHNFFIKDFTNQLKQKTKDLDELNKSIQKLQFDIDFHKGQITSIKTKRLFEYLHKCSKVLFARPGYDWHKILPLAYGLNGQAIIIIKKPHLGAAMIEVVHVDTRADFTLKQWQRKLFYPLPSYKARAIKQSAELKKQFEVVSAIMISNYTQTNNQTVLKMAESYLFCANNPHLKIK